VSCDVMRISLRSQLGAVLILGTPPFLPLELPSRIADLLREDFVYVLGLWAFFAICDTKRQQVV